jgi:hypothetical protein
MTATLTKAIDNATTCQVIRRQLDPHAVAEHEPDAIPLHPSAQIAERLVAVVELNPEHTTAQGFHDLALELDLLLSPTQLPSVR